MLNDATKEEEEEEAKYKRARRGEFALPQTQNHFPPLPLTATAGHYQKKERKERKGEKYIAANKKNVLGKKSEQTPCFPSKPNLKGREQALTFPPTFFKKKSFPGFGFHASFPTCSFPSYSSSFSGWTHLSWVGREMSSRFAAAAEEEEEEEEEEEKATTTHNAREQKCGIRQHCN